MLHHESSYGGPFIIYLYFYHSTFMISDLYVVHFLHVRCQQLFLEWKYIKAELVGRQSCAHENCLKAKRSMSCKCQQCAGYSYYVVSHKFCVPSRLDGSD